MTALDIAIIGGGAAGMVTAHLLDPVHRVTVLEKQPILGGNIRTLGRGGNVECPGLPADVTLDAGVIEFSPEHFPAFHRLMARLDVPLRAVPGTTGFIRTDGTHYRSIGKIASGRLGFFERLAARRQLMRIAPEFLRFRRRAKAAVKEPETLVGRVLDSYMEDGPASEWFRLLMVYAYSIPRGSIGELPAELAIPTLLQFSGESSWTAIVGGVYTYIRRIVEGMRGDVRTDVTVTSVRRDGDHVWISIDGEEAPRRFDRVVFATTPEQVLKLLQDPSDAERRWFRHWEPNWAVTVIHDDDWLYEQRGISDYSEFDVFEWPPGYNAYLNRLAGLSDRGPRHYHFTFGAGVEELSPANILHRQSHYTPSYTVAALATRAEILRRNGERHTYFAGAWLGNGLHEGAVQSALRVSGLLGGDVF